MQKNDAERMNELVKQKAHVMILSILQILFYRQQNRYAPRR